MEPTFPDTGEFFREAAVKVSTWRMVRAEL
jgi:hypothetical protein